MTKATTYTADKRGASSLTPAQLRVLKEVGRTGETYRVLAERLGASEQTVKNHMMDVHDRLYVSSTIEAFIVLGWLKVPE